MTPRRALALAPPSAHVAGDLPAFGSKAETLSFLSDRLERSRVPALVYFTVGDWRSGPRAMLARVAESLRAPRLAVRSSTRAEDAAGRSLAGRYRTRLGVENSEPALVGAIGDVVASYEGGADDQVLVQEMVADAAASGVVVTEDPESGAPYYLVEYHDGSPRTDVVTSGLGPTKTVWVHHGAPLDFVRCPRLLRVLAAVREIEQTWGPRPLEIEFAECPEGAVFVLQVRPIGTRARLPFDRAAEDLRTARIADEIRAAALGFRRRSRPRARLLGRRTILGQMPDWNPAELIGTTPSALAVSVFRFLVGDDVWQRARASLGYRAVPGVALVRLLAGRPFVDVRASFNSFLPEGLPERIGSAVVDAWLDRLQERPELHDRVELEVAQTAFDLDFHATHRRRFGGLLGDADRESYATALRGLTSRALAPDGTLAQSLRAVERLARDGRPAGEGSARSSLERALAALSACRASGTLPFAVVARHAFIAEALLRSAVRRGALDHERWLAFRRSLRTVVADLAADFAAVHEGRLDASGFLRAYGHLRPGTFDVVSLRYDQRPGIFSSPAARSLGSGSSGLGAAARTSARDRFGWTARERSALDRLLREAALAADADGLLDYARRAIVGRERAKFLFTRSLSDALESLACWGGALGLSREELAHASLADLRAAGRRSTAETRAVLRERIERRRGRAAELRRVRVPHLVCEEGDLWVCPDHPTRPTFVTRRTVVAPPVLLHPRRAAIPDVRGRIVCIESADPGFDWIFARPIAGIITGFGGGNSHMAIRAVELDVSAALGVGEHTLARLARSPSVELRAGEGIVRSLWPDVLA
jgi:glutamine kinase